jgi:tetratricopeptide (TPR) repeat protein
MPDVIPLIQTLEQTARPWWLAAMRQDAQIWRVLLTAAGLPALEALPLAEWSPAALSLAALHQPPDPAPLRQLKTIPPQLRLRAGKAFERHTQPRSALTPEIQTDLAEAGLLALALRERRRLIGHWDGLAADLHLAALNSWRTPLACLFGMIPDPLEMLRAVFGDGLQPEQNTLALHALLSNPLPPTEQAALLESILPANPLPFLQQLASLRPDLARSLAATQHRPTEACPYQPEAVQLAALAGDPQTAMQYLAQASQVLRQTQASLDAQTARLLAQFSLADSETIQARWRQAVELDPSQPGYWAALAHALLDGGQMLEAANVLQASIAHHHHPEMGFALARLAYESGDNERARHLCIQTLHALEHSAVTHHPPGSKQIVSSSYENKSPCTGDPPGQNKTFSGPGNLPEKARVNPRRVAPTFSPIGVLPEHGICYELDDLPNRLAALGMLLLELGRPRLAVQAAELALQHNPANADLLALLAQAHFAANDLADGLKAMQLATLLNPGNRSLRRQYAARLEGQGDWHTALTERQAIVAREQPEYPADLLPDLYALAVCSLHAGQPQVSAKACQQALAIQSEDGPLHALLGEALTQMGEENAASEHFNAATLLSPGLPKPWLALAQAFQRQGEHQKALETLHAAAQAAPQSAEIHLALGEAYLAANAPTPALEALHHASDLSPNHQHLTLPLAQALHRLGYLHEARQVIEASPWRENASPQLAYTYAQVLLALGELANALPALQVVIAAQPADAAPYLDYACTLLTLHQELPQAIEALRHVLAIAPHQITARAFLAEALAESGNLPAALEAYQIALESELGRDALWRGRLSLGLGEIALHLHQTDTAIAALHEASQFDPENPHIYHVLADAYQLAGLQQNALQAMRAALHYNPDALEELLWFAEKAQALVKLGEVVEERSQPVRQAALIEAAQALRQAIALAPHRSDLRLHLATCLMGQTDSLPHSEARDTLRQLLNLPEASTANLQQAAHILQNPLGDTNGAIACLEKAIDSAASDQVCDLLNDLAHAHQQSGDPRAALQSIERALALNGTSPDTLAELRRVKAHLLIDLKQPDEALQWAETALLAQPGDAELHHLAAELWQEQGQLTNALSHIEHLLPDQPLMHLRAADLARALLQFERASSYLTNMPAATDSRLAFQAGLLQAELAFETDAEIAAAKAFTHAIEQAPFESVSEPTLRGRMLALQARLTLRRGDLPAAFDLYQQAREVVAALPEIATDIHDALAAAAFDLEDWETGLPLARQNLAQKPHDACAHLHLARVLVRRAEMQRLCEAAHSHTHTPGMAAIAASARREFERAIKGARQRVGGATSEQGKVSTSSTNGLTRVEPVETQSKVSTGSTNGSEELLNECEERGRAAFQIGGKDDAIQPYQIIAALLAQAESEPTQAWKATQEFLHSVESTSSRSIPPAILHYLLAYTSLRAGTLAQAEDAIQVALALWPDEPRWLALAAEICLANGDALRAVEYAEQSVRGEPRQAAHHLLLGQALLALHPQHANPLEIERRARLAFEQSTRLDPNQPEAWYALAHSQLQAGEIVAAAVSAEQAINLAPEQTEYLLLRAQISLHNHQPDEALQNAQAALNIEPKRHTALLLAARALQALDRPNEALALLDQPAPIPTDAPTNPVSSTIPGETYPSDRPLILQLERVRALAQTHGHQAALLAAHSLAETYPENLEVLSALAHLQAENGEREAAIRTAQRAIQNGKDANGQISKSTNESTGKAANPRGDSREALEADLHHLAGELYRRAGQLDQAVHHLSQSIRMNPQGMEAYLALGQAQQERRQYRQALAIYQQAIALAPQDPRPHLQAGLALKDGKNYLDAESMLRRAAELAPKDVSIRRQLAAVVALNLVHNRCERALNEVA